MGSAVFSIIFCVLATVATVIAVGMAEVRADDKAASQAPPGMPDQNLRLPGNAGYLVIKLFN